MSKRKTRAGYVIVGGGFAEYAIAPLSRVVKLSWQVDLEEASLIEPLACCIHSMKKSRLSSGDTVAIIGAGPMGTMHLELARLSGVRTIMIDVDEARLDFVRRLGADEAVNARVDDPVKAVKDFTEGRGADAVFVTTNDKLAGEQGVAMVGRLGCAVFYSSSYPPVALNIDWNRLHYEEITIAGTEGKTEADFQEAVKLLENGKVNLRPLVSKIISLAELPAELGASPQGEIQRVVVKH
jgi:L-iditol 2-dehydrogenase